MTKIRIQPSATSLMSTYSRSDLAFVSGKGVWLFDKKGKMFLGSALLSVCGPMVLYSTVGLRGGVFGWVEGERGTSVGPLCALYSAFFTKPAQIKIRGQASTPTAEPKGPSISTN